MNYLESEKYFRNAISADKKYSVAYLGLAKSLYQQQKNSELKSVLSEGIQVASKNGDLMPANEMQSLLTKINII
jgi:Tfp pilus assembly protein PilF